MKEGKLICPVCGSPLNFQVIEDRKVGGESYMIFSFSCPKCGYSGVDIFPLRSRGPMKIVFRVDSSEKLNVLVARSSTARVEIPELGIEITPGPASRGFITTVEGIILRVIDVLKGVKEGKSKEKIHELEEALENPSFTLIIYDPFGTSSIDSRDAEVVALGKDFKSNE